MFLMTIAALIFVVGFIVILLLLSARSPVSARLMAVTSQTQATQAEVSPMGQRQPVSLEQLANALGPVRKYLGFTKNLEISGVGYRAQLQGEKLVLALGYSHPVEVVPPAGIKFIVETPTRLAVSGPDKELVGQVAADIRQRRKPEPYKGKGIRYAGEQILRKAGKAGKVGGAK